MILTTDLLRESGVKRVLKFISTTGANMSIPMKFATKKKAVVGVPFLAIKFQEAWIMAENPINRIAVADMGNP